MKSILVYIIFTTLLLGCKGQQFTTASSELARGTNSFTVSWDANREGAVNRIGGGYRVYYGTSAGVDVSSAAYLDVPYVSGTTTSTTAKIANLPAGTFYVKVVAYSSIVPPGSTSAAASTPSTETSITVP